MRLTNIALKNFRNYFEASVVTDSDLILILGDNASGKTNFLESIYFLSRLKSFRAPDNLLVNQKEDFFSAEGGSASGGNFEAIVQINPVAKRQFKIDGQKIKRIFWQTFPVVLFVPNDLNLFHLGPILRRRFLDETIAQIDSSFNVDLVSLDHILKQKSALLEQIYKQEADTKQLELWNQELAPVALRITGKRQQFIGFLNQKLSLEINRLTGFESNINLQYKRMFAKTEEELLASLFSHQEAEIRSGQCLIGPHRDDFTLEKDGELNIYNSSRGELRSQILALKLLQAEYLSQTGKKPIILLDDVFSELDETRRAKLIENLAGHQIFITSTEEHHLPKVSKDTLVLKVANNKIKSQ